MDWTTGLTFDHKNSFTERSVGHEMYTKMSTEAIGGRVKAAYTGT